MIYIGRKGQNHLGEKILDYKGNVLEVIKYINERNIDVLAFDGTVFNTRYDVFLGGMKKEMQKIYRTGETNINNQGCKMMIVKYDGTRHCTIKFEDGTLITNANYNSFLKGEIRNYNYKSVYGIGYYGYGKYTSKDKAYTCWFNMMTRCYNSKYLETRPTYLQCSVCEEWHNYQHFAEWYHNNYYEIPNETMCLDKDILRKRNKIYSPETCVFVTSLINSIFTKRDNKRGDCCIGISKKNGKYQVYVNKFGKSVKGIHSYDNELDAFMQYKKEKEKYIKEVAEIYKNLIPNKLYKALYSYEVEFDD